ncbi:carboxymuconolactone decarboxylase family protein [Alsobacter sp. SYSU M60028]|uniref:Carboxymuconolactone decarboxylase family protein n=1 Tax=Alsobacter ponti TaxID=2962936 RepID=A0ABT1L8V7_9HYPH|nr:carboxymuconolactone decarboxylase family protein [Alsobacter ponti]MCP8937919.1 carboxymuconolactone decarboxylase family protein [Alsobacter ponti]
MALDAKGLSDWTERLAPLPVDLRLLASASGAEPARSGALSAKLNALLAIVAAVLLPPREDDATARTLSAAAEAGATSEEIAVVVRIVCSAVGKSLIAEMTMLRNEARGAGVAAEADIALPPATRANLRRRRQWDEDWDALALLPPDWSRALIQNEEAIRLGGVMPGRTSELFHIAALSCARPQDEAAIRGHMGRALELGATVQEISEVLRFCARERLRRCAARLDRMAAPPKAGLRARKPRAKRP